MKYALLSALLVAGCTNDDQSLTISRFVTITASGGGCVADPATTTNTDSGLLDVQLAQMLQPMQGYILAPVVRNNLISMMTATSPELNNVYINSFDVELKQNKGDTFLNGLAASSLKFNIPSAAGLAQPGMGQVAALIEVIPAGYVSMLQNVTSMPSIDPIIVHIRANGAHSGVTLSSSWSDFPVYLCAGCLLNNLGACPATGGFPAAQIHNGSCYPQQDGVLSCCTPAMGAPLCGSQVPRSM
jgi:hypothetical protein